MPLERLEQHLEAELADMDARGVRKGREKVITGILPATGSRGPRYTIDGYGDRPFLRMNSNAYLGLSLTPEVIRAEEAAARAFGAGPGAVRFISGTWGPHVALEAALARFHRREAAMIFSAAYAAVMGVITPLISPDTIVLSDELNHNCIINAIRLSRPKEKFVYRHLDTADLAEQVSKAAGRAGHLIIVTDGIFSMRGDHAPLGEIGRIAREHDAAFERGVTLLVDDSHGVGAFGETGRGTEEATGAKGVDMIVATLGKALGVNGGYIVASAPVIAYLRETSPFYVYSNPITPAEAAAALKALDILDSDRGRALLDRLRRLTRRFEQGLTDQGYEIIPGEHPVVPVMIRDTPETAALVGYLFENGVLATGLNYPVVPRGAEEIRFQVSADHTDADIDEVLDVLSRYRR
jgi:glycine C-acetyltransferase